MLNGERILQQPLRWAMIGGGRLGQDGYKHRTGALRDNTAYQLVAGAFDIDPARGESFGVNLGVDKARCYPNYRSLLEAESARADGVQVVSIATPNGTHYEITKAALEAGLHVICEKPLFFTVAEGEEIRDLAKRQGKIVGVTYGFSGYPLLMQMRAMIARGDLGEIRIVDLQYTHGFSATDAADKQVEAQKWRIDPKIAGPSFVLGDLSTHTYYMSRMILPQLRIKALLCDRQAFIKARAPLEDNARCLMHYDNGAVGTLWASAVNTGCMDGHRIRIVGAKASLEWWENHPNELRFEVQGQPAQLLNHGMGYLDDSSNEYNRLGALHTEGLSESWGNIYLRIAIAIDAMERGDHALLAHHVYPDIEAGIDGIRWVTQCVRSADAGATWVPFD